MTVQWIDVSHHDWDRRVSAGLPGQLDWNSVAAATSLCMCARASYGDPDGYNPPTRHFADFQNGARAAGFVLRGGYHNVVHGDTASHRRQVDLLRGELDRYACNWAMADIERYAELVNNGLWPRWDDVLRFRDAWYAVEDRPMCWYLPKWLWSSYYSGADLRQLPGPLVQSHYAGGDGTAKQIYTAAGGDSGTGWDDAYGNRLPDIWQFTSSANVTGATGSTDVNAYRGTLTQLAALLTGDDTMSDSPQLTTTNWRVYAATQLLEVVDNHVNNTKEPVPLSVLLKRVDKNLAALDSKMSALAANFAAYVGTDLVDEDLIVSGVLAGLASLTPQAIADKLAAVLPADLAAQVVAALGAKLVAPQV